MKLRRMSRLAWPISLLMPGALLTGLPDDAAAAGEVEVVLTTRLTISDELNGLFRVTVSGTSTRNIPCTIAGGSARIQVMGRDNFLNPDDALFDISNITYVVGQTLTFSGVRDVSGDALDEDSGSLRDEIYAHVTLVDFCGPTTVTDDTNVVVGHF